MTHKEWCERREGERREYMKAVLREYMDKAAEAAWVSDYDVDRLLREAMADDRIRILARDGERGPDRRKRDD